MRVIDLKPAREAMSERSRGDASDMDGQTARSNGAFGKSDIEGKAARVAASETWAVSEFQMGGSTRANVGNEASFKATK